MRTRILIAATVLAVPAFGAVGAYADQGGNADNGSACGQAHAARADVNGNYGFLGGAGGTPGYHNGATGQDPGATGSNNSQSTCQQQP